MRRTCLMALAVAPLVSLVVAVAAQTPPARYDVIIRHGTVLDGTGAPRYRADVAIAGGSIARVGDLAHATAEVDIDATGLFVAPGFINIHSHAAPDGLMTAANMLTQGVTTEMTEFGQLQTARNWASFTGLARLRPSGPERSMTVILDQGEVVVSAGDFTFTTGARR